MKDIFFCMSTSIKDPVAQKKRDFSLNWDFVTIELVAHHKLTAMEGKRGEGLKWDFLVSFEEEKEIDDFMNGEFFKKGTHFFKKANTIFS